MNWIIVLFFFLQAILPEPKAPGIYYKLNNAEWISLQPAPVDEMKVRGMEMFVDTGAYTNVKLNVVCRGAKASLRISVPKPTFFVRDTGSAKDVILIRLIQKKDKRTYKMSYDAATIQNKGGFDKGNIHKTVISVNPDNSFLLTPEEDLKPGEYLLVFGNATAGFDFGIDPLK